MKDELLAGVLIVPTLALALALTVLTGREAVVELAPLELQPASATAAVTNIGARTRRRVGSP